MYTFSDEPHVNHTSTTPTKFGNFTDVELLVANSNREDAGNIRRKKEKY